MLPHTLPRALLDAVTDASASVAVVTELEAEDTADDTLPLRIAAIFIILATGLFGAIPPLFLKVFRNPDGTLTRLVRSFSAGVIIALALVHIVPEAVTEMVDLGGIEYPLGGTCVLFGVALMVFLEHTAHIMHDTHSAEAAASGLVHCHSAPRHTGIAAAAKIIAPAQPAQHGHGHGHGHDHGHQHGDSHTPIAGQHAPSAAVTADQQPADADSKQQTQLELQLQHAEQCAEPQDASHSHVCVSRGSASNWLAAGSAEAEGSLRLKIVAYMFELGCIFHSFIIGITLGVNQTSTAEVRALLIALAFHQWLEGISLSSVINRGGFPIWKGLMMIVAYSLTCPVGIAVGMGIAETYDAESEKARAIQGTFNGVSGGMLLYISLVQLVAEDMSRFTPGRGSAAIRLWCCAALFGGMASMCLLAVWA